MDQKLKPTRSGINAENIQEVLDAEDSAKWATLGNQQQYFTPDWLAEKAASLLPNSAPASIIDPQFGRGTLVTAGITGWPARFGIDIDSRINPGGVNFIRANCVKVFEAMDDLYPDLRFEVFNANPPFGKRWTVGQQKAVVDSTVFTWTTMIKRGCAGYLISNRNTIERLQIHKHRFVTHYETFADVWPHCEVVVGLVVWHNPDAIPSSWNGLTEAWSKIDQIIDEEKSSIPPFNVWLHSNGKLKTYLSTRNCLKHKLTRDDVLKLTRINGSHPLTLTTERETRTLLNELIGCGFYAIEPKAYKAITDALGEVNNLASPIMPITDFELVAYADEEDHLACRKETTTGSMHFTVGQKYPLTTATYPFCQLFTRTKVHFDEETQETYSATHKCTLSGQDRYIQLRDDNGAAHRFMDRPTEGVRNEHEESLLWEIFERPAVKTIADVNPNAVARNVKILKTCEMLAGYSYYPGQVEYLSRVAVKDHALIAADVGTGKTLMAITLLALKAPDRALIIAPQGTMRSSDDDDDENPQMQASQWILELRRFAPYLQVFELFSLEDSQRILKANGGVLPPGVYVSYYQAMFQNGARERCPSSWTDAKMEQMFEMKLPPAPVDSSDPDRHWCDTVGREVEGIRCIIAPCLATRIGHLFDMVLLDEAHICTNLDANVTQMLIRLQPRYRYALTATPIPNIVSNLFSLMGWLCVPDWYKGDRRNAAWPYAIEDLNRFADTFLSVERDLTQEAMRKEADPEWSGKCEKASPVISSPARLLKLLRPTLAYISKQDCNPNYREAKIVDIRVRMGREQAGLYSHFLNRANIKCKHPLVRARKQIAYLRAICADPGGFMHGGPHVASNFNPKTTAILELTREILARGEQTVIVCARIGQTTTIQRRLLEAGVPLARIDSTVAPEQHAYQANLFKTGKARVILMGIKCAMGYSFPDCPNLIVGSLEYSNGSLHQAKGRIDRVNSKWPATIYCVLHCASIEELMFDIVATKQDAATICLLGKRIPREFKPVEMSEVLASAIAAFSPSEQPNETDCEDQWPALRDQLRAAITCSLGMAA